MKFTKVYTIKEKTGEKQGYVIGILSQEKITDVFVYIPCIEFSLCEQDFAKDNYTYSHHKHTMIKTELKRIEVEFVVGKQLRSLLEEYANENDINII